MTREEEIQKIRDDWEHDMKYPYCAWVKGQETFATFIDEHTESKLLPEKWEVHAPKSDVSSIGVLLKKNQQLREALENVTHPINNLSSQDALEYHADVCKTVEEALEGETK